MTNPVEARNHIIKLLGSRVAMEEDGNVEASVEFKPNSSTIELSVTAYADHFTGQPQIGTLRVRFEHGPMIWVVEAHLGSMPNYFGAEGVQRLEEFERGVRLVRRVMTDVMVYVDSTPAYPTADFDEAMRERFFDASETSLTEPYPRATETAHEFNIEVRLHDFFSSTRSRQPVHYNVAPRHTSGSPAMVDERTALRVARQERVSYERSLEGFYGEESREKAQEAGISGIVEVRREKKKSWDVLDLCTGERFERPFTTQERL
jgi:hypothetical protein